MRRVLFLLLIIFPCVAWCDLASTAYVQRTTSSHLDTASTANQTMAGTYTVSGTLVVPTPALPTAE